MALAFLNYHHTYSEFTAHEHFLVLDVARVALEGSAIVREVGTRPYRVPTLYRQHYTAALLQVRRAVGGHQVPGASGDHRDRL